MQTGDGRKLYTSVVARNEAEAYRKAEPILKQQNNLDDSVSLRPFKTEINE